MGRSKADDSESAKTADRRGPSYVPAVSPVDAEPGRAWTDDDWAGATDLDVVELAAASSRPALGAALRRRALLWCATALAGLAIGAGAYVAMPPPYKASAAVLLTQPAGAEASDVMLTEVALAQSRTVAAAAMRDLGLPVTVKGVTGFIGGYAVTSPTDRILEVTAKGSSATVAVSRARAVINEFLKTRDSEIRSDTSLTVAALDQQLSQDRQKVATLTAQIATESSAPPSTAKQAQLTSLRAERAAANSTLTGLEQTARSFQTGSQVANETILQGSQVLDPAVALPRSRFRYPLLYGGGGLIGGLVIGMGLVVVQALLSKRPRSRLEVSRALGAPVLLSVVRSRPGRGGLEAANGDRDIQRIVAHLQRAVPEPDGSGLATLAVVAMDDPGVAALSVVALAAARARAASKVVIADLTPGLAVAGLLGVTPPGIRVARAGDTELLVALPEPDDVMPAGPLRQTGTPARSRATQRPLDRACGSADLLITLTTLDPALGAGDLGTWADEAVVILTAGRSSATRIHAVGEMIRLADVSPASAVMLGADKFDESLGMDALVDLRALDADRDPADLRPGG
jgi:capsular polysaccharide biosynthesis protein